MTEARPALEAIFGAALAAVDSGAALRRVVERRGSRLWIDGEALPPEAPVHVIAVGKAAVPLAEAFEAIATGLVLRGLVVTKDGHGRPLRTLALREAGHPVPDERSAAAGRAVLEAAARAGPDATLVVLLSGGASALLTTPLPGLALADLRATTELLLRSGAAIDELNCVRKHLTAVSGGRLAAATQARRVCVLAVSDVLGDDLSTIGSGPCASDETTYADALDVLSKRGILAVVPRAVRAHLEAGAAGHRSESVRAGDPALARVRHALLATNRDALAAAARFGRAAGYDAHVLSDRLRGEARTLGRRLAALARQVQAGREPALLLAGGEPTVTVRGAGRGGRASELALAAALELAGRSGVSLLAAGTDGTDGPTDAAGAYADGGTCTRGGALGLDAATALENNDAYGFFAREGGLFTTGPTGTNVMDLVLVRIDARA